jgi:RNA polymerase sigma-70 factor (ECF subfamily)
MGFNQNDQSDFIDKLCSNTWNELYRFIYYKVQNREEAQDITQETYVRAISYLQRNNVKVSNIVAYLKAIALNIIRDHWRMKKRRGYYYNIEDVSPEQIAEEDFSDFIHERAIIEKAMKLLTEEQQQVLTLRIIEGYSVSETAERMKRKEGYVRVLQFRAIKALTKILKREDK